MSHSQETRWDANTSSLYHVITTVYKGGDGTPGDPAVTDHGVGNGGGQPGRHGPAGAGGLGGHGGDGSLSRVATDDAGAAMELSSELAAAQLIGYAGQTAGHGEHEEHISIRAAEHKGHRIEVHTAYRVFIDGQELGGHFGVDDEGATHYHGLPNYQEASALDLVKTVIDQFPDDFPDNGPANGGAS